MVAYSFQGRFVAPICVGLGIDFPRHHGLVIHAGVEIKPKRQTIRAVGLRRHARPGETLQLYRGMRTKQCFKIGDAPCTSVEPIRIMVEAGQIILKERGLIIDRAHGLDAFARDDGFGDWTDMRQFWRDEHAEELKRIGPFTGLLIKWEPHHGG